MGWAENERKKIELLKNYYEIKLNYFNKRLYL